MIVYAVFKEAVYRHECGGIYSTSELAIEAANAFAHEDRDDHHTYEVRPFEMDTRFPITYRSKFTRDGDIKESDAIYVVRKPRPFQHDPRP